MARAESRHGSESATTRNVPSAKKSLHTPDGRGCTTTLLRAHTPLCLTHSPHSNSNSKSNRNRNGLLGATPGNAPPPGAGDFHLLAFYLSDRNPVRQSLIREKTISSRSKATGIRTIVSGTDSGRYTARETDAHDAGEDPDSEQAESCEEESDLTTAFERENGPNCPRLWEKNWKTHWTSKTWKICESFQSPCMRDWPPSKKHTQS